MKKIIISILILIPIISCNIFKDSDDYWKSVDSFPTDIYLGNFEGFTKIDQHYNVAFADSTDWNMRWLSGNNNRSYPLDYGFSLASANPGKEVIVGYVLAKVSDVRIIVTDRLGNLVKMLFNGRSYMGHHYITWQGLNDAGYRVKPGLYRVHLYVANSKHELYSYGDVCIESDKRWVTIPDTAKKFAEKHFTRQAAKSTHKKLHSNPIFLWGPWRYTLPVVNDHKFYEDIALNDIDIFGWDDWQSKFNYQDSLVWSLKTISDFSVWKGNEVTNPKDSDYGKVIAPYSSNREKYIELLNR